MSQKLWRNIKEEIEKSATEIFEIEIHNDAKEVAVMIAGYIAEKKIEKRYKAPTVKQKLLPGKVSLTSINI